MAVLFHIAKGLGEAHGGVDLEVMLVRLGKVRGYSVKLRIALRELEEAGPPDLAGIFDIIDELCLKTLDKESACKGAVLIRLRSRELVSKARSTPM